MTLTKAILPDSIEVSGVFYPIHTGHSYWFLFSEKHKKIRSGDEMNVLEFDFLYIDKKPDDRQAGINALERFFLDPHELPREVKDGTDYTAYDYELDARFIYAAFMHYYSIDLFEKQIHWHKFKALFAGLKDTQYNEIMNIRGYVKNKKPIKMELLKKAYEIIDKTKDKARKNKYDYFQSLIKE